MTVPLTDLGSHRKSIQKIKCDRCAFSQKFGKEAVIVANFSIGMRRWVAVMDQTRSIRRKSSEMYLALPKQATRLWMAPETGERNLFRQVARLFIGSCPVPLALIWKTPDSAADRKRWESVLSV